MSAAFKAFRSAAQTPLKHSIIYNEKHVEVKRTIKQVVDKHINPNVQQWEADGCFPAHEVFKRLGDAGALAVNKPTEYGGLGLDFSYSIAVAEELGRVTCGAIPMAVSVQNDMATPALAEFGSDHLRREFLTPSITGDAVACLAISEPEAGSDVAAIRTHARWDGSDLIISGSKLWITNGTQADWACVLVNTNQHPSLHRNKSLLCIRLDEAGIHRSPPLKKLGMQSSDTAQIFFDDVRVPSRNIIGDEGRGFVYQMMQFQDERLVTAAVLLEPLKRCIDLTIDYTRNRNIFNSTVLNQQIVHYSLAELQTELEALKALLYATVAARIAGEDVTLPASMAKLKAGRLARQITDSCMQFWGGQGYLWDNPISQLHRDLRLHSIGAGCDQVMLSIICKYMDILPKNY
ncbi:unnamed protein product [Auanema sp. JU1783]|nr:unnamed protein product [Auanema sp. JU1783]